MEIKLPFRVLVKAKDWNKAEVGSTLKVYFPRKTRAAHITVLEMQPKRFIGSLPTGNEFRALIAQSKERWVEEDARHLMENLVDDWTDFEQTFEEAKERAQCTLEGSTEFVGEYTLLLI